jgi:hypothetical protein
VVARRVMALRPQRIHGSALPYLEIHKPTWLPAPGPLPPPALDRFYPPGSPYSRERLRYEIDAAGHYGDGTPLADGAALLLFAETILSAPPPRARPATPPATPTSRRAPPAGPRGTRAGQGR